MEKQTPVEWLALRYHHRQGYLSQDDIAEAKTMEKEQIMKAASTVLWNNSSNSRKESEQYYNETYNK
jgi:hypothetical protein